MSSKRLFLGAKKNVDGSLATAVKCLSAKKERQKQNISISLWSENQTSRLPLSPVGALRFSDSPSLHEDENSDSANQSTPVSLFEPLNTASPLSTPSPSHLRADTGHESPRPSVHDDTISVAMFKPLTNSWRTEEANRVFESSDEESGDFEQFLSRMKTDGKQDEEEEEEEEERLGLSDFIVPDDEVESSNYSSNEEIEVEEEEVEECKGEIEEEEEIEVEEEEEEEEELKEAIETEEENALKERPGQAVSKGYPSGRRDRRELRRIIDNIFSDDEEEEKEDDVRIPPQLKSASRDVETNQSTSAFLLSLSEVENVGRTPASKYIRNFKTNRAELTERLFKLFNEEVFLNKLPGDMPVEWSNRLTTTAGQCRYSRSRLDPEQRHSKIRLSTKVCSSAERVRDTLAHEMCHAATWVVNGAREAHGTVWRGWARRVTLRFPQLPPVSTTHAYVIFTKYTYRCTQCGANINRHSRSINMERMVCSLCHGTFELVVNSRPGTRAVKQGDGQEGRRLNPFAQFVRENYAATKRDAGNHAEAMRQLSRMFAALKTPTSSDS